MQYDLNNSSDYFIAWDPKLKTGIQSVDKQHKHLVHLCNSFYQSLLKNKDKVSYQRLVKNTLEKCLNYTETHFRDEEKLMIASNFSGYNEHKHTHDEFREKCHTMYAKFDKIPVGEAIKFAHFLYDWIQSHIAYEDKLYIPTLVEFLKKRKEK